MHIVLQPIQEQNKDEHIPVTKKNNHKKKYAKIEKITSFRRDIKNYTHCSNGARMKIFTLAHTFKRQFNACH